MDKKNFYEDVYDVVRLIPEGRWTSYGAIAHFLGIRGSARMVGWAMNSSHGISDIPAHRVLNREGRLTGKHHFNPQGLMQKLLEEEGLIIEDEQILNAEASFWDPSKELEL